MFIIKYLNGYFNQALFINNIIEVMISTEDILALLFDIYHIGIILQNCSKTTNWSIPNIRGNA